MGPTRPAVLVVKVVQALVVVVVGFMSLTADGRLTMGGLLGKGFPVFQQARFIPYDTYTNVIQARGYVRKP